MSGGVFPFPSQSIGYGIGKAQQGDTYNQWKKSLKRGPTYKMIGLKRAGLNPILAAGGGLGATSAGALIKANSAGGGDSLANPTVSQSQIRAANAVADLNNQGARKTSAEADVAEARAAYWRSNPNSAKSEFIHQNSPNTWAGAGTRAMRWGSDATWEGTLNTAKGALDFMTNQDKKSQARYERLNRQNYDGVTPLTIKVPVKRK